MGSKKRVAKKKVAKKKVTKKVTKKKAVKKVATPPKKTSIELLDEGFNTLSQEFAAFQQVKLDYYENQGIAIDRASHEPHWLKVFTLGKIYALQERIEQLEKGATNVQERTTKKAVSGKANNGAGNTQLELSI